jgi:hypothetical protein
MQENALMVRSPLSRPAAAVLLLAACGLASGCAHSVKRAEADVTASKVTQIGVNSFLWRSTLDTLSFMPMLQVDSNGGVILTDWYINPRATSERMKLTVTILDQDLRADALRVAASRQVLKDNAWIDAPVEAATTQKLEDIILTHARDLRRRAVGG